jgi:hypothetical protein
LLRPFFCSFGFDSAINSPKKETRKISGFIHAMNRIPQIAEAAAALLFPLQIPLGISNFIQSSNIINHNYKKPCFPFWIY